MSAGNNKTVLAGWKPAGFIQKHKVALGVLGVYVICSMLACPVGEFPLNDDWSYAKSILVFVTEGRLDLGLSSSALLTQILWGSLFVKAFGFSFTLLRLLTWVSVLVSVFFFNDLLKRITSDARVIWLCCLALVLNPVYFSLSHTFMTDVHFCCLLIVCAHQAYRFWEDGRGRHFAGFFVASLLLVFLRQFGIIVPFAFSVACLFFRRRPRSWGISAIVLSLVLTGLLLFYEKALMSRGEVSYQAASGFDIFSGEFWARIRLNLTERYKMVCAQIFVYGAPLFLPWFLVLIPSIRTLKAALVLVAAGVFTWLLYDKEAFPLGNIFTNMSLGAETFYESLDWKVRAPFPHTYSTPFQMLLVFIHLMSLFVGLSVVGFMCTGLDGREKRLKPLPVFCAVAMLGYVFFLFVSEMYFDRYHLPLLVLLILMVVKLFPRYSPWQAFILLLPMIFLSVAGTHDYFGLNRQRWAAYHYLRQEKDIVIDKINGGNEVHNWHEGEPVKWDTYLDLSRYDYLIQYRAEPGFRPLKEYPLKRWLSLKADKIYIFEREKKSQ